MLEAWTGIGKGVLAQVGVLFNIGTAAQDDDDDDDDWTWGSIIIIIETFVTRLLQLNKKLS